MLRFLWLWQPERQLLLHQAHLREAVEGRNWGRLEGLIDPGYSDGWGYTRETGMSEARQWLGQFFAMTITAEPVEDHLTAGGGIVTERWKMEGTGTEAASMVVERVNSVTDPFVFQWKHGSWKPWDWTLARVDNAGLNLSPQDNY
ncbi:MAG: hypothetical protein ABSE62_05905 [Chthoniobacteraceae bacterium]